MKTMNNIYKLEVRFTYFREDPYSSTIVKMLLDIKSDSNILQKDPAIDAIDTIIKNGNAVLARMALSSNTDDGNSISIERLIDIDIIRRYRVNTVYLDIKEMVKALDREISQ